MKSLLSTCAWVVLAVLASCAWADRDNRPVWNAFEEHLVPDRGAPFWLTLPLTIPVGVAAIATDTLIVHPASVVDDAFDAAADLWRGIDWNEHYYTALGSLPFRVVGTPCVFVVSFLCRSAFDIGRRQSAEELGEQQARFERDAATSMLAWIAGIRDGGHRELRAGPPRAWSEELQRAYMDALTHADALGRAALLRGARVFGLPPYGADPWRGLRDADPLIRAQEIDALRDPRDVPLELRDELLRDPVESVRLMAHERFATN